MYEPIIDPMVFYWMDVVSKLQLLPIAFAFMVFCTGFVTGIAHDDYSSEQNMVFKCGKVMTYLCVALLFISIPLSFFIPDKTTMSKMIAAKYMTPHNIQVTGETAEKLIETIGEKLDKVADKATDKVVRVVQEVKK